MTAPKTKELRLDSTDLKWLGEKIASFEQGNLSVDSATIRFDYVDSKFTVKRVDQDPGEGYGGRLVLVLRVPA